MSFRKSALFLCTIYFKYTIIVSGLIWGKTGSICYQQTPLIHRLFLDHDIEKNSRKTKKSKILNTFDNIMVNRAFAPLEQMLHFP